MCSKYDPPEIIGERGDVKYRGRAASACTTLEASTGSAATSGTAVGVSTCVSPLVVCSSVSTSDSESSCSLAATATFADAMAGSVTSETSLSALALITRTPSTFLYFSARTPTLNPSRNPELASTRLSLPAVVLPIENVASMPSSVTLYAFKNPIGDSRRCSSNNFVVSLKVIEPGLNIVEPADVEPSSFHVTMRPEISRFGKSVAVTLIEKSRFIGVGFVSFIGSFPLLVGFHRK